jgi:hypothetical protein
MKTVSNSFAGGTPPQLWQPAAGAISADLRKVAETFVELQEARHEADYDHVRVWTRQEAIDLVQRAEQVFQAWQRRKTGQDAAAYLVALVARAR